MDTAWPASLVTSTFSVRAASCPQVLSRLVEYFALRDLVPETVRLRRRGDELTVSIEQGGLDEATAQVIAEKMRSLVMVMSVTLEHRIGASRQAQ